MNARGYFADGVTRGNNAITKSGYDSADDPNDMVGLEERDEFVFKNGAKYKGQWKNDMRHGYGVQSWPDGAKY